MVLTACKPLCCLGGYSGSCLKKRNCSCHPKKVSMLSTPPLPPAPTIDREPRMHVEIWVDEPIPLHSVTRAPVIHINHVTETGRPAVLKYIREHGIELRELGMEPSFTLNGEGVDLDELINAG